ncbi:MAG: magnesium transporter CorA family protein [Nitrososphaerales archaeon]
MAIPQTGQSSQSSGTLQSIVSGRLKWTDMADPTVDDTVLLGRDYGFHPLDLQDCLSGKVTKVEDHGEHIFLLLHFPEEDAQGLVTQNRLSMFLGKDYIVTLHSGNLAPLVQLFASCRDDPEKRASFMKSSAYVAYRIIDALVAGVFTILDDVQGKLDEIESVVFDETKSQAVPINHARHQLASLGRILFPIRLYIPDLAKAQKFSDEDLSLLFSDLDHKVALSSGTIDEMKELLEIYKDTDFVTSSNRTNTVLSILTIIFTLTIPATLLSSIYGMNIPLPGGLTTGPLEFAGPYSSFLVIFILMLIPALVMVWYFRRAGWF